MPLNSGPVSFCTVKVGADVEAVEVAGALPTPGPTIRRSMGLSLSRTSCWAAAPGATWPSSAPEMNPPSAGASKVCVAIRVCSPLPAAPSRSVAESRGVVGVVLMAPQTTAA